MRKNEDWTDKEMYQQAKKLDNENNKYWSDKQNFEYMVTKNVLRAVQKY